MMYPSTQRHRAYTLVEMLVVMAIIAILAALLLPAINQAKTKARRIQCVSNLRQTGVGFHLFLHDHDNKFPMQVSTNDGGSLEFIQNSYLVPGEFYFQYRHFQTLSNELHTPRLLACPTDTARFEAGNFSNLQDSNISYFIGANAEYSQPNSILAGDRNISSRNGGPTIYRLASGTEVRWTGELHKYKGNVLFADGRVEQLSGLWLKLADQGAPPAMDLILPSVKRNSMPPPPNPPPAYAHVEAPPQTRTPSAQAPVNQSTNSTHRTNHNIIINATLASPPPRHPRTPGGATIVSEPESGVVVVATNSPPVGPEVPNPSATNSTPAPSDASSASPPSASPVAKPSFVMLVPMLVIDGIRDTYWILLFLIALIIVARKYRRHLAKRRAAANQPSGPGG